VSPSSATFMVQKSFKNIRCLVILQWTVGPHDDNLHAHTAYLGKASFGQETDELKASTYVSFLMQQILLGRPNQDSQKSGHCSKNVEGQEFISFGWRSLR